jgi:hypothetical protein
MTTVDAAVYVTLALTKQNYPEHKVGLGNLITDSRAPAPAPAPAAATLTFEYVGARDLWQNQRILIV